MAISMKDKKEAAEILAMEAYRLLRNEYRVSGANAEKVSDAVYEAVVASLSKR